MFEGPFQAANPARPRPNPAIEKTRSGHPQKHSSPPNAYWAATKISPPKKLQTPQKQK